MTTKDGTTYNDKTPPEVVRILEYNRQTRGRLRMYYGDAATGRAWGDVDTGYTGRSTGTIKIPLCVPNARSMGGGAILDHCIVKIETTRAPRRVLWQHPTFTEGEN